MQASAIEQAASLLAQARLAGVRIGCLPETCRPAGEADAYAIQDALNERLAQAGFGAVIGHKIGCTTAVMQRYLGIGNSCAGGVFARDVHQGQARLAHGSFVRPGVECEIAVRLARDLPPSGAPYNREKVPDAVRSCMAAIEIVDDRYEDYRALGAPTLIADDFFAAGCVLGAPVQDWQDLDLTQVRGCMRIDGKEVGQGRGGDILGHPFEALAWLANALVARGRHLKAGEFVLLGSVVQTVWLEPGAAVEVKIEGLGEARLALV